MDKKIMGPAELECNYDDNMKFIDTCEEQIALIMRRKNISEKIQQLQQDIDAEYVQIFNKEQILQKEAKRLLALANAENKRLTQLCATILEHIHKKLSTSIEEKEKEDAQVQKIYDKHVPHIISDAFPPLKSCLTNTAAKTNSVGKSVKISTNNTTESGAKKKSLSQSMNKLVINQNLITPKMSINEYKSSPLVKRPKVNRNLMFSEFEMQLNQSHFDKISKYMRGRETLAELNIFLEKIIIPCFNEKYQLMHRERSSVRNLNELELWKVYNEQTTLLPGCHFITPGDISRKVNKILDKKLLNRLTILRHIGLLQEKRIAQTTCYIWNSRFI